MKIHGTKTNSIVFRHFAENKNLSVKVDSYKLAVKRIGAIFTFYVFLIGAKNKKMYP